MDTRNCKDCGNEIDETKLQPYETESFCYDCRQKMLGDGSNSIKEGEHHPAADSALRYINVMRSMDMHEWIMLKEAMASTALSGNRLAEICLGTMERIDKGYPLSDRYVLGLAWAIMEMKRDKQYEEANEKSEAE